MPPIQLFFILVHFHSEFFFSIYIFYMQYLQLVHCVSCLIAVIKYFKFKEDFIWRLNLSWWAGHGGRSLRQLVMYLQSGDRQMSAGAQLALFLFSQGAQLIEQRYPHQSGSSCLKLFWKDPYGHSQRCVSILNPFRWTRKNHPSTHTWKFESF